MEIEELPDLCLDLIASELCKPETVSGVRLRNGHDMVCDAIALSLAQCDRLSKLMRDIVDPKTFYDNLGLPHMTVRQLKEGCRAMGLRVSGNSTLLRLRMREAGERTRRTGMISPVLWTRHRDHAQDDTLMSQREITSLATAFDVARHEANTWTGTRRSILAMLREKYGDIRGALDRSERAAIEKSLAREARQKRLIEAIALRDTVEIQFFRNQTQYPDLLRSIRNSKRGRRNQSDREFDRDFGSSAYWRRRERYREGVLSDDEDDDDYMSKDSWDDDDEEEVRRLAKAKALKIWLETHSEFEIRNFLPPRLRNRYIYKGLGR
jgi:hypothetical protein